MRSRLFLLAGCLFLGSCLLHRAVGATITLRVLGRPVELGILAAVRRQLRQLSSGNLRGVVCSTCLMVRPQGRANTVQGSVLRSQLGAAARARGLPSEVAERLELLSFSRSVTFHTFSFVVNSRVRRGYYELYVGAGRRVGDSDTVEFGVVRSTASAQLVAKSTPVRRRKCKRRFFIKRCRSWTDKVPRGLTAQELSLVEAGLRRTAVAAAVLKLSGRRSAIVSRSRRSSQVSEQDAQ